MDQLRAAMAARKAEVAKAVSSKVDSSLANASPSAKKPHPSYVRRADLEVARLQRLRKEEETEKAAKVRDTRERERE